MAIIKFKVAARTDVGLVRTNNEDNFQISRDLSVEPMRWVNDELCQLGTYGCLLVVADGMGGANAGEVASHIAMETIKKEFIPSKLKNIKLDSNDSINTYIKDVIKLADANIKNHAQSNPETHGMGTTIVVAWIINDKLYIGWCGDSRAYLFNSTYGLVRITKDHSYVQQLVDSKKLTEEEAFDFPDSNIITRCLSDSDQIAIPDTLSSPIVLSCGDIVMLCTDGLCGMLRDESISTVMKIDSDNLTNLTNNLITAALKASGADNVTVAVCKICSGVKANPQKPGNIDTSAIKKRKTIIRLVICLLLIGVLFGAIIAFLKPSSGNVDQEPLNIQCDSTTTSPIEKNDTVATPIKHDATEPNPKDKSAADILKGAPRLPIVNQAPDEPKEESVEDAEDNSSKSPDIIEIVVPTGCTPRLFMQKHHMNASDFKKLNPDIKIDSIKAGMTVKIYRK